MPRLGLFDGIDGQGADGVDAETVQPGVGAGRRLGNDPEAILTVLNRDKKRLHGQPVPFVLVEAPGDARPGCPVAEDELVAAVRELAAA